MKHNTKYWIKVILATIIITSGILFVFDNVSRIGILHENFKEGLDEEVEEDMEEEQLFEDQEDMNAVERTIQSKKDKIQVIMQKAKEEERILTSDEIKKMNESLKLIERLRQFREILAKHDTGPSVVASTKSRLGSLFS